MTQLLLFNVTNGLIVGAFYVLMALGLSLILNLSNVINFAHGGFLVIGGYIAYTITPYVGFLLAPPLTAIIGLAVERVLIRPLHGRDPLHRPPAPSISTAAISPGSPRISASRSAWPELMDDLIERGLDPAVPRLFIINGSKALAEAIRRSFGRHTLIQRCQIHKAGRLSPALHASVRRALRQAWELDDAAKTEKLIRNLAQRLERGAPGVSKASSRDWMKSSQ
jgi:hypothetical protein